MTWNSVFKIVPCGEPRVLSSYCTGSEVAGLINFGILGSGEFTELPGLQKYFSFLSLRSLPLAFRKKCFSLGENPHTTERVCKDLHG